MFALRAALFPLQREPFSCRDTHTFQQNLISPSYSLYSFCSFFLYFKIRFIFIFASCSLFSRFSAVVSVSEALNETQPEYFRFSYRLQTQSDR